MLGITILDVAIGLIFIFFLYSLLATTVQELIASVLALRANMLKKGIKKMLEDQPDNVFSLTSIFEAGFRPLKNGFTYLRIFICPGYAKKIGEKNKSNITRAFFHQTCISKFGENSFSKKPSYLKPAAFSKALVDLLMDNGKGVSPNIKLDNALAGKTEEIEIDPRTRKLLESFWEESKGDIDAFRKQLEEWYDSMMERVSGWYTRMSQRYVLVFGLIIAISFNVDTISIVHILSKDKDARESMANMATEYVANNPDAMDRINKLPADSLERLDTLFLYTDSLIRKDIYDANNLLGAGWTIPKINSEKAFEKLKFNKYEYEKCIRCLECLDDMEEDEELSRCQRTKFFFCMLFTPAKLIGFILTALAISLGATFWFNLLNKLINIRSTGTKPEEENEAKK